MRWARESIGDVSVMLPGDALVPVVTGYSTSPVRGSVIRLLGRGFGRVTSVALMDTQNVQWEVQFQVENGATVMLTIPQLLPNGSYVPVLGTLDNTASQNFAGALVLPALPAPIDSHPPAPDPIPDPASSALLAIRARARLEYGDFEEDFQASTNGDGVQTRFDLPEEVINTAVLSVRLVSPVGTSTTLSSSNYVLNARAGVITLTTPPAAGYRLVVSGTHYQFYTDDELDLFIRSAALKHTHSAESLSVTRLDGFKHFLYTNETVDSLPPVEYHLLAMAAAIEALEVIQSDAAYDIDVNTAEGTSLPRAERFANITQLIAAKTARYEDLCRKLGVGLSRIEVFTLRRVSRTTGRLVPVYVAREYDDVRRPPLRLFAPRNLGVTGSGFVQDDPYGYGAGGGYVP